MPERCVEFLISGRKGIDTLANQDRIYELIKELGVPLEFEITQ